MNGTVESKDTILVVDDEEIIRTTVSLILKASGYNVLLASDGLEGVETFQNNKDQISLVLLDRIMPRLDGPQVFEKISAIKPDVKVVMSSGMSYDEEDDDMQGLGVLDQINKPFRKKDLLNMLEKHLG